MAHDDRSAQPLSIGVDVGGTFTDLVVYDAIRDEIRTAKVLTTPRDIPEAIFKSIDQAQGELARTRYVKHGTTTAINTALERTGARTALITTRGFRDVLELGRGNRPDAFDLFYKRLPPLVPRDLRFEIGARMNGQGREIAPVDPVELDAVAAELDRLGVEAVAVCLLHAYRNPEHERQVGEHLRRCGKRFVSLSHHLSREWREYERTSTAVVNAYVGPRMERYLETLGARLGEKGLEGNLLLMESNGGVMTGELAAQHPVYLLESGPVAGAVGAAALSLELGYDKAISFDMGGTTAKCTLVNKGEIEVADIYYVAGYERGYPVQVPVVDIVEVGAGGGSIAHLDEAGSLKVGPRSAGSEPGPVSYGRGGTEPTVTDANVALGRLSPSGLLGGDMALDVEGARHAIREKIAEPLGLSEVEAASGILRLAVVTMSAAVRRISIERGHDPRDFVLVVSGGAGPLHASAIARELSIPTVLIPPLPGHFSAWGMLLADIRFDTAQTLVVELDDADPAAVERQFRVMEEEAKGRLLAAAPGLREMSFSRFADLRYVGQEHTVRTPADGEATGEGWKATLQRAFLDIYAQRYGHADPRGKLQAVTLRVVADGRVEKPRLSSFRSRVSGPAEPFTRREAYFEETGWVDCPVYHRDALAAGQALTGPVIVTETGSTTVIAPGDAGEVDSLGNIVIRVSSRHVQAARPERRLEELA
ncbi:hydantoinase/oxoprolinase family protein [Enterovirga rhinocerotis]|uniref:N-methylhydantoinase A n=1 Tax=Enterovirga rhinocerotis TaxID=1339210 RepID=A0A4R7BJ66_9HYPH|nr:hydantoinase/oxoprolinase family protein [Enterovirga rhinocerotis]TDR84502.1 N-methylhydantoinase A [Enterovirga rhinocerotis]